MKFTKEMNDGKHVFVFGSNLAGRHGAGAALEAKKHWGAFPSIGHGRVGNSYAIPTKDYAIKTLPLDRIKVYVEEFLEYARENPSLTFLVTAIGTGLAGYTHADIAPMFRDAPSNCVLPDEWAALLNPVLATDANSNP